MPQGIDAQIEAIRRIIDEGRYQEAVDECRALLFEDPESPEVLALLREASQALESDVAPKTAAEGESEEPKEESLADRLAHEFGDESDGASDEEVSEEPSGLLGEDKERVEALVKEGEDAFSGGRYQEAIDVWSRVYIVDLNNRKAQKLIEKARVALDEEQRKWDEIIQEGNDFLERHEYAQAEVEFRKVLELSPGHAEALEGIERVLQAQRADQEKADKSKLMMVKAAKLFKEGNLSEAIYTWEKVLELEPDNARARQFLTEARAKMGEPVVGSDRFAMETTSPRKPRAERSGPQVKRSELLSAAYAEGPAIPRVVAAKSPLPKLLAIATLSAAIVGGALYFVLTRDEGELLEEDESEITEQDGSEGSSSPTEDVIPASLDPALFAQLEKDLVKSPAYADARKAFQEGRYREAAELYGALLAENPTNALLTQQIHRSNYNAAVMALRQADVSTASMSFANVLAMDPSDSVAKRGMDATQRYLVTKPDDRLRWFAQLLPLRR